MTFLPSRPRLVRLAPVFGLFLAIPILGSAQRFGGPGLPALKAGTSRPAEAPPSQQPAAQTPTGQRSGQGQFWEWWRDESVKKEMGLTDRQVRDITRVYENRSREMKPHSDEFQKQFMELDKMTRERTVDLASYSIQVTRVEALRTELSKTRTLMLYQIYRMLTPEQYDKLREIRDRRRSGRGGGGPR